MTSTLILVCFLLIPRSISHPIQSVSSPDGHCSQQIQSESRSDGGSATRQPLQPWTSAETRTPRWAPETDSQWGPRHLDSHRDKTTGTRWVLYTIWLCCSWNKLLVSSGQRRKQQSWNSARLKNESHESEFDTKSDANNTVYARL